MKREKFGSRLGFILVSAGCAIGIGNVWKFPYMCGEYGGAAFILLYLFFLLVMGIPVLVCEFAIGRRSRLSIAAAHKKLEPEGTRWHMTRWIGIIGNYLLMMFYTTVAGWMLYYCYKSIIGTFAGASPEQVTEEFSKMLGNAPVMMFWTVLVCIIGFGVCAFGLQGGIERITKVMMLALLAIMVALAVHSVFLEGAGEGIRFYLIPDLDKIREVGIGNMIFGAMSQAFFTLSIGIGSMLIFGSYMDKDRSLTRRGHYNYSIGYFCSTDVRIYYYPFVLCVRYRAGGRSQSDIHNHSEYFYADAGRQVLVGVIFPVSDICRFFYCSCGI